jgi:serine/threonine-protein kinase
LSARLRRVGRIEEPALRMLAAAIADGMQAAHARGIVHRDLKPGNVMLRGDAPTIVDFGIAKSLGNTTAAVTERRVGTVAYMAPEQLTDGLITPAVDIWALGVILYEAATGRAPFANFNDGRLPQLFDSPPRAGTLASMSPVLDDLIARCLERDPGKRPPAMADVARVLRGEAGERVTEDIGAPPLARPAPLARAEPMSSRRARWPIYAGAATVIAIVAALLLTNRSSDKAAPATTPLAAPDAGSVQVMTPVEPPRVSEPPPPVSEPPPRDDKVERKRTKPTPKKRGASVEKRTTSQGETLD